MIGPGGTVFPGGMGAGFAGAMGAEADARGCAGRFKTMIMLMTARDSIVRIFLFFIIFFVGLVAINATAKVDSVGCSVV